MDCPECGPRKTAKDPLPHFFAQEKHQGWHSRRHKTRDAQDAAKARYQAPSVPTRKDVRSLPDFASWGDEMAELMEEKVERIDKYAHLAPAKSRSCFTAAGHPKVRYTQAEAEVMAHHTMELRQAEGEETIPYHAYQCPECLWYHVGIDRDAPRADA